MTMESMVNTLQNEERTNVTDFKPRLITGGKDPNDPDWLKNLVKGTQFIAKDSKNSNNFSLLSCLVLAKTDTTSVLVEVLQERPLGRVDNLRFSSLYSLVEILWVPEEGKSWPEDYQDTFPHQEEVQHEQHLSSDGASAEPTTAGLDDNNRPA